MKINDTAQNIAPETVGKVAVAIGGSGSLIDWLTEFGVYIDTFAKIGNVALIFGGLFLMYHKIFDRRRNRRESDG